MARGCINLSELNIFPTTTTFSSGRVTYVPGGTFGPRWLTFYQLVLIHRGHAEVTVDQTRFSLHSGQTMLRKPSSLDFFQFAQESSTEHSWIHAEVPTEGANRPALHRLPRMIIPTSHLLETLMEEVLRLDPLDPSTRSVRASLSVAAFEEFRRQAVREQPATEGPVPPVLPELLSYLRRNLAMPLNAVTMARELGYSPQHLARLSKEYWGETPLRRLWRLRVERGLALLRHSGLSVSEIAERSGFTCPFHFSRVIRQETGMAPREFRRAAWER